ncbi:hypothetical protein HPB49_022404 [Dermacentor silvarum]|uniref:Uncharacterized protein n=1 Tax=Dermacentor silvarum TaxID=543639 RepID=A0ACB8CHP5_DERSI|nr:hypothetical protein HPB49_022404 [Dermacentor silvarum]
MCSLNIQDTRKAQSCGGECSALILFCNQGWPNKSKTERCHREARVCLYCGRAFLERSECPAQNSVWNFCGKKGHFTEVCHSRKSKHAKLSAIELHALESSAKAKFVDFTVDNYTSKFKVDSGDEVSAVPSDLPGVPAELDNVDAVLTGPGGQPLRVRGSYLANIFWQGKTSSQRLYVIESLLVPLLGTPAIQALEVVKFLGVVNTPEPTLHVELFRGLGTLRDEYTVRLKQDAVPFSLSAPRRIPIPLLEFVRQGLEKLEGYGVARRIDEPPPKHLLLHMMLVIVLCAPVAAIG